MKGFRFNDLQSFRIEDHGFSLADAKQWRADQAEAGRTAAFEDFLQAKGLCHFCRSSGVVIVGKRQDVPLWDYCRACAGSGRLDQEVEDLTR